MILFTPNRDADCFEVRDTELSDLVSEEFEKGMDLINLFSAQNETKQ
jgi:hypothetical protein